MNKDALLKQWLIDEEAPFKGWDFSYIKNRKTDEKVPWDYIALCKPLVETSHVLLDMATGGGELFSKLAPFPKTTYAIEGYEPNVTVAKKCLEPLGVQVLFADPAHRLSFDDNYFDVIANRHGAYNVPELQRILQKGGKFITQQVSGDNLEDLENFFGVKPKWSFNNLTHRSKEFLEHNFTILDTKDWSGKVEFLDVGALVYFLKAIPWIVDNFSVHTHRDYLFMLQEKLEKREKLEFTYKRHFIFVAKN